MATCSTALALVVLADLDVNPGLSEVEAHG